MSPIFYRVLTKDLENYGFVLNQYDPCVANKIIEGSQCTLLWYVDDLKISHVSEKVVQDVLKWLKDVYGEIRTTRGTLHDYLGMDIDFSHKGEVKVSMKNYLQETIDEFPEDIEGTAATSASLFLFIVNDKAEKLDVPRAKIFHTAVARLLFVTKRVRGDIITAISFLTTRVREPDADDWKKLKRVLKYLKGTIDLTLTLTADKSNHQCIHEAEARYPKFHRS